MCGIVGNVLARRQAAPDADILRRMAAQISHRGPDEEGFFIKAPVGLGIRRLKIIDLETGQQPMTGEDRRIHVVFNGEISNYPQLTCVLKARGHQFTTRSDTEVIVHAFEDRGLAALKDLEGMFAIAIWDANTSQLVLARDRLGIKPLYYAVLPDQLVFGSEIKALLAHPAVGRTLDLRSLSLYLAHEYVPAPRSIFRAIKKLPPGHWLTYSDGHVKVESYWDVRSTGTAKMAEDDAVECVREALERAVRQQLVSDVPLGIFLSGGLDSTAVTAFAARHASGRLRTFSIGFEDPSFDESAYARHVAQVLGTDHHEEAMTPRSALDLVPRLPDLLDEPLGDASFLPTYLLARFARASVTVALSGDGGDELFGGYPTYQAHRLASAYQWVPSWIREGLVRPLVERLPVSTADFSLDFRLKRFVAGMPFDLVNRHAAWLGSFTPAEQQGLLNSEIRAAMDVPPSYDEFRKLSEQAPGRSWLDRVQYLDLKGYLSEGVLTKVDRASMACSLEVRVPILDRHVVELAFSLPGRFKLSGMTTKYLLRRMLRGLVPKEICSRKKKGFGIPLSRWFRHELLPVLREFCSPDTLRRGGIFRPETVDRLIAEHRNGSHDHRKKLYTIMAFQLWASRYHAG